MKIHFSKYQGTGNDFILLDNRGGAYSSLQRSQVEFLCDRRFGIGADGLILLEEKKGYDFGMRYFNSDGNVSSMCGNGGRCITDYANSLHLINGEARFEAIDGEHLALIRNRDSMVVKLKMGDVKSYEMIGDDVFLDTGSPHYIKFLDDVSGLDVVSEGRKIRNSGRFKAQGTNVNFVASIPGGLRVRSYERGVEDETLSCGTGVTASVLAASVKGMLKSGTTECDVESSGGKLKVYFNQHVSGFTDVWLEGPSTFVYSGEIDIDSLTS